jgi:hypothetical protein
MGFCVEALKRSGGDGTVRHVGDYEKLEEAISAAKRVVDRFLLREFSQGMDSKVLFSVYQNIAEFPFIFRDDDKTINVGEFNHFQYAMQQCTELCTGKKA